MSWLLRRRDPKPAPRLPHARPVTTATPAADDDVAALAPVAFTCTTCGRSDLPEAGDWDPPICQECDAAINFDAIQEAMDADDW